ncbi:protein AF-9 [Aethina tumida]|uniref:protein AF-9 n=1 Tax=Aethina tumida TaxID=116153 RepID=UPI00096B631A|nr:protein AF-9 [Aethina tumida]
MSLQVTIEIGHEASIRSKKTQDGFTHDWELFVRGVDGADIRQYIDKVIFHLHQTFPNPRRVIKNPPYSIKESGYAGFSLPIDIYLKNNQEPKRVKANYDLYLQDSGPPVSRVQKEHYTFTNLSDEFKNRLLKGGAVPINTGNYLGDRPSSHEEKNQMTSKPKLAGVDIKKPKMKQDTSFENLFGTPFHKSESKMISSEPVKSKDSKSSSSSKNDKNLEKIKSKSPHKDKDRSMHKDRKESESDKKSKDEKKSKEKLKEKERSKDKNSKKDRDKSPGRVRSPSPKRSPKRSSTPPPKEKKDKEVSKDKEREKEKERHRKEEKRNKKEKRDHKENKLKDNDKEKEHKNKTNKEFEKSKDLSKEKQNLQLTSQPIVQSPLPLLQKTEKKEKIKEKDKEQSKEDEKPEKNRSDKSEEKSKHKHKKKDKDKHKDKQREDKSHKTEKKSEKNNSLPSNIKENGRDILPARETDKTSLFGNSPKSDSPQEMIKKDRDDSPNSSKHSSREPSPHLPTICAPEKLPESEVSRDMDVNIIPPTVFKKALSPKKKDKKERKKEKKSDRDHEKKRKRKSDQSLNEDAPMEKMYIKDEDVAINNNSDDERKVTSTDSVHDEKQQEAEDYMSMLRELQHKIMGLKDNSDLQRVVQLIAETGQFEVSAHTFDFDLCLLDRTTVSRLQDFFRTV